MTTDADPISSYEAFIPWARSLLPADRWLTPIAPDAWSVGEVVAHLLACDRFILTERLPAMRPGADLPPFDVAAGGDVASFNTRTAAHARTGISPDSLVAEFVATRQAIVNHLRAVPASDLDAPFTIDGDPMTLRDYVTEQVEHNREHRADVDTAVRADRTASA